MRKVIPTVFAKNKEDFDKKFKKIIKISKEIQIDFMDGRYVKAKGVKLSDVPNLKGRGKFEAHLMVSDPEAWISDLKKKGFSKVLFHYDAIEDVDNVNHLVFEIKKFNMAPWIVFNSNTDFNSVKEVLSRVNDLSGIMFMGVKPGKEGQVLDSNVCRRIGNVNVLHKRLKVEVDGGVNDKTIEKLKKSGADIVSVGSFVSGSSDPKGALDLLKKKFN